MFISRHIMINYKVNFGSPAEPQPEDGDNLQAIKNSVPDYEKIRTMKMELCLDKFYSSLSSNN